jgi:hypothetical protein
LIFGVVSDDFNGFHIAQLLRLAPLFSLLWLKTKTFLQRKKQKKKKAFEKVAGQKSQKETE